MSGASLHRGEDGEATAITQAQLMAAWPKVARGEVMRGGQMLGLCSRLAPVQIVLGLQVEADEKKESQTTPRFGPEHPNE